MKNLGYSPYERARDFSTTNYSEEIYMIDPEDNRQPAETNSFSFAPLLYNIPYGYKVRTHRKYYTQHCVKVKRIDADCGRSSGGYKTNRTLIISARVFLFKGPIMRYRKFYFWEFVQEEVSKRNSEYFGKSHKLIVGGKVLTS